MGGLCIGLVSPGEMGAAVARSLIEAGNRVLSVLGGRSRQTVSRATDVGVEDVVDLATLVGAAEVVLSIVPPSEASEVADRLTAAIRATGAAPLVVEANAISPARAEGLRRLFEDAGARFVDGDLIGGPPGTGRPATRLFLSGPEAGQAASALVTPELEPVVLSGPTLAASSLKMAYATWTKGSAALALAARSLARSLGVEDSLLEEWRRSQPDVLERCEGAAARAGRAWRFSGEMSEIASSHAAVGLPPGFGEAAAEIYLRMAPFKGNGAAHVAEVVDQIVEGGG